MMLYLLLGPLEAIDEYTVSLTAENSVSLPQQLEIIKPRMSTDELGYTHVRGQIYNRGDNTANYVKIVGSLYDVKGDIIGTDFTFTEHRDIFPEGSSDFDLVIMDTTGAASSFSVFAQSIEYSTIFENPILQKETSQETAKQAVNELINNQEEQIRAIEPESPQNRLTCGEGMMEKDGKCVAITENRNDGCLIATATFGSELAPQVQQLRETRDNVLLQTSSGSAFMTTFNQFYYSFSPTVADWERQNPLFKEAVKLTITPLISTLSILNYVDIDSEAEMMGYGISVILLNIGMYFVAPAFIITRIRHTSS